MILLLASTALATDRVEGADTLAMGSTAVANPYAVGGVNANPAAIGLEERYIFSLGGHYGGRGGHWQITAIDSQTSPVAFGITYSGDRYNPPFADDELPGWEVEGQEISNRKNDHDVGLAVGAPLAQRQLVIALGGNISFYDHERGGKGASGNVSVGVAGRPREGISLGVAGRHLLPIPGSHPMELVGSAWLGQLELGALSVEAGARPESSAPLLLATGLEINPSSESAVRAGWRLQDGEHLLALGAGGGTHEGSVDIGLQMPVDRITAPIDWTVMLSLRFLAPDIDAVKPD